MNSEQSTSQPNQAWTQPKIYENASLEEVVDELDRDNHSIWLVSDEIKLALGELYETMNPSQKDNIDKESYRRFVESKGDEYGVWAYFPWNGNLVRFPKEQDYWLLRTARNRNLITEVEQKTLSEATVLVAGMSVGSNVAETMAYQATAGKLILADMDHLEPTNLNRIRAPYSNIGDHKVDVVGKRISELDPFVEQVHYKEGIDEQSFRDILEQHKPQVVIDEVDNLAIKIMMREYAIEKQVPVVMATDDGEDILIDVERYDIDESPQVLHGLIPDEFLEKLHSGVEIDRAELGMIIGKHFVGFDNVPLRMLESLKEVGKTIPAWPQLGTAATLAGVIATYCAKQIILGHNLPTGRKVIGPDLALNPDLSSEEYSHKKQQLLKQMMARGDSG